MPTFAQRIYPRRVEGGRLFFCGMCCATGKLADVKAILIIAVVLVIAATVLADYKWRRWMAARRADQDGARDRRA